MASAPIAFEVFLFDRGRFVGSRIFAGARQVSIGRAHDATLRLEDPLVSGRHAVLFVKEGRLQIGDDGSSNGVFVNGRRVQVEQVGPLDEIRLGESRIKVEIIGDDAAEVIPPPEQTMARQELTAGPAGDAAVATHAVQSAQPTRSFAATASAPPAPILQRTPGPDLAAGKPLASDPPAAGSTSSAGAEAGLDEGFEPSMWLDVVTPPEGIVAPEAPGEGKGGHSSSTRSADDSEFALPYPPAPPEIDEEAEEERNFVPSFSLLESLVLDSGDAGAGGVPMVEILRYRGDRLLDAGRVDQGGTYEIIRGDDGKSWRMVQLLKKERLRLFFRKDDTGNLMIAGQRTTLAALADDAHLFRKKKGIYAVDLNEGDRAQLWIDGAGFYIRPVRAPRPPPKGFSFKVSKEDQRYVFAGFAGIVLMLGAIWVQALISPPELIVMEEEAQFAEISLKDLEMEKPPAPPEPPPPPPVEVQAPAPEPQPQQAPAPTPQPRRQPRARASAGAPAAKPTAAPPPSAADNALAALAGIVPTGESKLNAAVSNIAAVRAPSGTSSNFAVSGAIGKVPGDEVSLSRGGKAGGSTGSGRETRAAAAVLAGTNVGQVGGGGGTGRVRGRVTTAPARSVGTTGGSLSKDAIAKVVAEATSRVQSCYERELIGNPGLQGKITFEWVISPEGSVSSSRVSSSSLPSQAVATCISGVIRGLQFPKPSGGSVSVTYPFAFASQGF